MEKANLIYGAIGIAILIFYYFWYDANRRTADTLDEIRDTLRRMEMKNKYNREKEKL